MKGVRLGPRESVVPLFQAQLFVVPVKLPDLVCVKFDSNICTLQIDFWEVFNMRSMIFRIFPNHIESTLVVGSVTDVTTV